MRSRLRKDGRQRRAARDHAVFKLTGARSMRASRARPFVTQRPERRFNQAFDARSLSMRMTPSKKARTELRCSASDMPAGMLLVLCQTTAAA